MISLMSNAKLTKTIREPKSVYVWEIKEGWGITTDFHEALEMKGKVRTATKDDMEGLFMLGGIDPKKDGLDLVMLNDGIYIYIEGKFINEFGDEDCFYRYVKVRDGNLDEDKLSVEDFVEICRQIKENGKLDSKMTGTLKYCNFSEEQKRIVMDFVRYLVNDDILSLSHDNWFKV